MLISRCTMISASSRIFPPTLARQQRPLSWPVRHGRELWLLARCAGEVRGWMDQSQRILVQRIWNLRESKGSPLLYPLIRPYFLGGGNREGTLRFPRCCSKFWGQIRLRLTSVFVGGLIFSSVGMVLG